MIHADGPPLDPSPDEAHQWVVEELRKGVYRDQPGVIERFLTWLRDHLHFSGQGPGFGVPAWLLYAVALVVLVGVGLVVLRSVRRDARGPAGRRPADSVLGDDRRSAAELRAAANAALAEGSWDDAVVAGMRAVAAGVVERSVLEESPGRTAYELAGALGPHFPGQAVDLRAAARAFDTVRYGHLAASESAAREVVAVDAAVAAARPVFPDTVPAAVGGAP